MPAPYERELECMTAVLRRMRLTVRLLHPGDGQSLMDNGLRGVLGLKAEGCPGAGRWNHGRTIYRVTDQFLCHYVYFHLPDCPA